jgi:hypothetical protein
VFPLYIAPVMNLEKAGYRCFGRYIVRVVMGHLDNVSIPAVLVKGRLDVVRWAEGNFISIFYKELSLFKADGSEVVG